MQNFNGNHCENDAQVLALVEDANILADKKMYQEAIGKYKEAWDLIPEPRNIHPLSTAVMSELMDVYFLVGHWSYAKEAVECAISCPGGCEDSFLRLRYGQILFDHGELNEAFKELKFAYGTAGFDIFRTEDPRYLDFLKARERV